MDEGKAHETPLVAEKLPAIDGCWGKVSHFSLGVGLLEVGLAQVEGGPTSMCMQAELIRLSGL